MIDIQINFQDGQKIKGVSTKINTNLTIKVPEAIMALLAEGEDLAVSLTHFITHQLQQGWEHRRAGDVFSLYNTVWYAGREFSRTGVKRSTGTPHDVITPTSDFVKNNIEKVIATALWGDIR